MVYISKQDGKSNNHLSFSYHFSCALGLNHIHLMDLTRAEIFW